VNCRLLPKDSLHVKNRQELVLYYVIETNLLPGPILYMAPILRTGHSENVPPLLVDESGSLEVLVRRQLRVTADNWGRGYCIERAGVRGAIYVQLVLAEERTSTTAHFHSYPASRGQPKSA
jgi:hypothetical protein